MFLQRDNQGHYHHSGTVTWMNQKRSDPQIGFCVGAINESSRLFFIGVFCGFYQMQRLCISLMAMNSFSTCLGSLAMEVYVLPSVMSERFILRERMYLIFSRATAICRCFAHSCIKGVELLRLYLVSSLYENLVLQYHHQLLWHSASPPTHDRSLCEGRRKCSMVEIS